MPKQFDHELHARVFISECIELVPALLQEPLALIRDSCLEILGAPLYPHGEVMRTF